MVNIAKSRRVNLCRRTRLKRGCKILAAFGDLIYEERSQRLWIHRRLHDEREEAELETIYSPQIHYEYDASDVIIEKWCIQDGY